MSDGARKRQKLKLNATSKHGSPQGSRSESPDVPSTRIAQAVTGAGSRTGSPSKSPFPYPYSSPRFLEHQEHISLFPRCAVAISSLQNPH